MIEFRKHITRAMLRNEREKLFVFGDNAVRSGYGGQAKEMRDEPNAVGIITKRFPDMDSTAFLDDKYFNDWLRVSKPDFEKIENHILNGGIVVWPKDDIGTGLANLPNKAPKIWNYIQNKKQKLMDIQVPNKAGLIKNLKEGIIDIETKEPLEDGVFANVSVEDIKAAIYFLERLK